MAKIGFFRRISLSLHECKLCDMRRNRLKLLVIFALSLLLGLTGCKNVKDIRVNSVEVESLNMRGFKSVDIFLKVEVDNPAKQVKISEIDGSLKHSGKVIGKLAMDPFTLVPKSIETYSLKSNVSLAQGAGFKDLMLLASPDGLDECTVDISAKAAFGKGAPMPVKIKDVPLKELLDKFDNENN